MEAAQQGMVGMACLIIAESAIFLIFVVAYIYYIGKSLSGPTPQAGPRTADHCYDLPVIEQLYGTRRSLARCERAE